MCLYISMICMMSKSIACCNCNCSSANMEMETMRKEYWRTGLDISRRKKRRAPRGVQEELEELVA